MVVVLILLIARTAITPVKRKHDKVSDPDDFEEDYEEPPESEQMQNDLERLDDYRRSGWIGSKTKSSEKSKKDYGKLFKSLKDRGVESQVMRTHGVPDRNIIKQINISRPNELVSIPHRNLVEGMKFSSPSDENCMFPVRKR